MKLHTFKGGIHPKEMKELSNQCPITPAFPTTKTVTIPVTMGGAPNTPLVKVGDLVAKGQIIATGDKFMNCPVHSSVSGKVKKIQNCLVTGNAEVPCIIIEADDENRTAYMEPLDPFTSDFKDAIARIKDAGITGMGGASFPVHVKLNPPPEKKIDYVLLNAAECEPYLTCDERTLQESTNKVIDGLAICLHLVGALGIIALEENKSYLKDKIYDEIIKQGYEDCISICVVKTAIVKRLVDSADGTISVTSEVGKGTTFTIEIPGVKEVVRPVATCRGGRDSTGAIRTVAASATGAALEVFIVDDVKMNLTILKQHLKMAGVPVEHIHSYTSAPLALSVLSPQPPTSSLRPPILILTDMWMPEMDGSAFAAAIRRDERLKDVRIVAVTADADSGKSFDVSLFDAILVKPVTGEKIRKLLFG